jgi:GcrA cell cycle regulator
LAHERLLDARPHRAIAQLWADGLSTAKIGDAIGASKNAVVGKAHRLNLPMRKSPINRGGERAPIRVQRVREAATLPPLRSLVAPVPKLVPLPAAPAIRIAVVTLFRQPCQWPTNGGRPWRFCSDPTVAGKPYCPDHCAIAYRKTAIQQAAA